MSSLPSRWNLRLICCKALEGSWVYIGGDGSVLGPGNSSQFTSRALLLAYIGVGDDALLHNYDLAPVAPTSNMPSQSQVRRVWNRLRSSRPRISRQNTHEYDDRYLKYSIGFTTYLTPKQNTQTNTFRPREKTSYRHDKVESGRDKDTDSPQQRTFRNDGCQTYRQRHKSESETQQIRPTPGRAVTFSAEQGEKEAQPSDPRSDKTWPRPRRTSTIISTMSSSGKSIKSGLKKLNCLPPIFAVYQGPPHSERDYHGPSRARTVPIRSERSQGSINGVVLPMKNTEDENRPKPFQTASTFPRTKMSNSSRNLQDPRTRLRARAETSKVFNKIWEEKALPRLQETMEATYKGDYSVTIQFDYVHSQRIIEVMTEIVLRDDISEKVEADVLQIFKGEPKVSLSVGFQFVEGTVEPSADTSSSARVMREDGWDAPVNTHTRDELMLGDSIGCEGIDGAATLGPEINFNGNRGYIVSRHLFEEFPSNGAQIAPGLRLVHPAGIDCHDGRHPQPIASHHADSGPAYKTQRLSRTLRAFTGSRDPPQVITDWAVFIALKTNLNMRNCLRYVPQEREVQAHGEDIPGLFLESPQLRITQCSGRSSGIRYGVVCETPATVINQSTGIRTREWYVENLEGYPNLGMIPRDQWNDGGIGIPGDSGAAIIDETSQQLMGQIWGRNVYGGDLRISRVAYFTHFVDVFDDINEHPSGMGYPSIVGQTDANSRDPPVLIATDDAFGSSVEQSLQRNSYDSTPRRSRAHSTDERTIATTVSERSAFNLDWPLKGGIIASK